MNTRDFARAALLLVKFRAELNAQHALRPTRPDFGPGSWIELEITHMHTLVNSHRKELGRAEVRRAAVEREESCASGHVDYYRKFPLYCVDLVYSDVVRP